MPAEEREQRTLRGPEILRDAAAVERNCRVDVARHGREVRVPAAHAEAGDPDLGRTDRTQPSDALDDVGAAVGVLQLRHLLHRLGGIAAAEAPVEVGRDGGVTLVREPFAHAQELR